MRWVDPEIGTIALPKREMRLRAGFGSGLAVRPGDPPGTIWAVCDRGPNLKAETLAEMYGVELASVAAKGAKIMPRVDLGPTIAELRIAGDEISLVRTIRLTDGEGQPISGLPMAGSQHARAEPAFDLAGRPLAPDPGGADSEGLVALGDGGFWVGDEYGPSLMRTDGEGRMVERWLPADIDREGISLPAIAGRRKINRGFEALTVSPDEQWLFLAFQSPLAHPDEDAHEQGRHVRLWRLNARSGTVEAQYLYPLDPPEAFVRDCAKGEFARSDIKVSELLCAGEDVLIVLERGSETTKLYRVQLDPGLAIAAEHLDPATRPTVEELSGRDGEFPLPVLRKQLMFDSDDAPQVAADLEGMAWLSDTELLLVSDNDFGVEGGETSFWRLTFHAKPGGD